MPFPDSLDTAQVSGQIVGYTGLPATATFTSPSWLIGDVFVPSFTVHAEFDEDGAYTVELPWTENAAWTPQEWTYAVRMDHGRDILRGTLAVPENTVTMDVQDGFNPDTEADVGTLYALLGHTHDDLPAHTHPISEVDDLQTQLDGKLDVPIEPYITASDVDHLQSQESAQEADALVVHLAGAETLTGVKDFTAGLKVADRFALSATGGMDWGPAAGPNDVNLYRAGSSLLQTDYGLSAASILVNATLRLRGYLAQGNAPTTGTWSVGDVVATTIGLFRCTVAGTPGTWVPMWREQALDKGYVAWNGDPGAAVQAGTIIPTGGLSFIFRLRALGPLISKTQMHCSTTATGVTNAWCTLHDDNGLILNANAKSDANQNTAFNSGGMKNFTFIAPQVVTPGMFYRARVWFTTGTTLPTISRMCNSNTAIINPDITGTAASTAYGWASADSGLTDLASAPDQIGNLTGANTAWWMGAK